MLPVQVWYNVTCTGATIVTCISAVQVLTVKTGACPKSEDGSPYLQCNTCFSSVVSLPVGCQMQTSLSLPEVSGADDGVSRQDKRPQGL